MAAKNYAGAPFGTQTPRFNVSGIHPQSKTPGTYTQVPYCTKSLKWSKLAPGCYNVSSRDPFSTKEVKRRKAGPGWKRAYEVCQTAKIPHLLHRAEASRRVERIRRLGPGTYAHTDFIEKSETKPRSLRGICATRDQRFVDKVVKDKMPGPGTYGIGGVPAARMEEKAAESPGNVGMLDSGKSIKRELQLVGCDLAPTRYNKTTFTEQILNKVVSKRGPYDLFTGSRAKPVMTGHLSVISASSILGPGSYELPSFTDDWQQREKKKHGDFSKLHQEGHVRSQTAGERINCAILAQCPRVIKEPGPGQYSPKVFSVNVIPENKSAPAFGLSGSRYMKEKVINVIGAGRYNISSDRKLCSNDNKGSGDKNSGKDKNSGSKPTWNFKSSALRFQGQSRQGYLKERIRAKDVNVVDRILLTK